MMTYVHASEFSGVVHTRAARPSLSRPARLHLGNKARAAPIRVHIYMNSVADAPLSRPHHRWKRTFWSSSRWAFEAQYTRGLKRWPKSQPVGGQPDMLHHARPRSEPCFAWVNYVLQHEITANSPSRLRDPVKKESPVCSESLRSWSSSCITNPDGKETAKVRISKRLQLIPVPCSSLSDLTTTSSFVSWFCLALSLSIL
jgi:hypothetical protein